MDVTQITAIIGASASLLCTLVVGALTYFIKKTLVYTLREDFIRSMNSVDHNISGLDQKLDRVLNLISAGRKEG